MQAKKTKEIKFRERIIFIFSECDGSDKNYHSLILTGLLTGRARQSVGDLVLTAGNWAARSISHRLVTAGARASVDETGKFWSNKTVGVTYLTRGASQGCVVGGVTKPEGTI